MAQPHVSDLNTLSPTNAISIDAQNKKLIAYLKEGNTIHFLKARNMGIGFLNSRIADLINLDYVVFKRWIKVGGISCKEYSFFEFDQKPNVTDDDHATVFYQKYFSHFAERLAERYGIYITFEEYVKMCKLPFLNKQKRYETQYSKTAAIKGFLTIQGKQVKVLRAIHTHKALLTALPMNDQ